MIVSDRCTDQNQLCDVTEHIKNIELAAWQYYSIVQVNIV